MKVFFTASQRGKKLYLSHYKKIEEIIRKMNFTVIEDDLLTLETNEFYDKFGENNRQAFVEFYEKELEKIKNADINIFDCSFGSLSIGFIIEKSLEFNKPTLVLYYGDNAPFFLAGAQDEKLIIVNYNEKNLEEVLGKNLQIASELRDKRFNFFISPEQLNYLEVSAKKEGITKSLFIRNLILEHRKKSRSK